MARVVLVLGQAQQGKTTLAWRLIREHSKRVLVLDPVRSTPLTKAVLRQDASSLATWTELATYLGSESSSRDRWAVILRSMSEQDYAAALAHAPYYRHVSLLVDEGLWFASSRACVDPLVKCARANAHFGAGLGVPLWITAQRPFDLPPDIRSQADQVVSFRQEEPRDLAFLSERFSPSFAGVVAELGNHRWAASPPLHDSITQSQSEVSDERREGDSVRGRRGRPAPGGVQDVPGDQRDQSHSDDHEVAGG